jgi:Tfp pilus assembly protein PilF/opacity protein-like surface antigen
MKPIKTYVFFLAVLISICLGVFFPVDGACQSCEQWAVKVVSVQGDVHARKAGQSKWLRVKLNDTYCPGDMIRVKEYSRTLIVLANETTIRLDQNTTTTVIGFDKEETFLIELIKGIMHFFSRSPRRLKVETPFVNATVEGTEFFVRVEPEQTFLSIFEGRVAATNKVGSLMLNSGQSATAKAGQAPALRVVVEPRDAVHWALYYPPVIYVPPGEVPKEDMRDPRFLAYRASQRLAVGRVDAAATDIQQALRLDPKYGNALALQAIIAVVQNEKDKAFNSARKAVEADPNSATARIALSYSQQARFELESSRASVEEAVKLNPNNALAWARLAELLSSFGNLTKALAAAKNAVELDPNLSRTQMVLGFAYLTQVKTTESKAAFEKAIVLDQADPLSRLGLGLAKIRDGDLRAGGREIEIAASLDPNNSIVRSYLGKTYFEEKRTGLDEREYAIAKQLDPSDPTPYFYDAITKQTTNRPVEALRDLQKAIELNDNRIVYRSRLLLDSDEAARSAGIARIYSDLGFQQRALVEGWRSVNTDPSNFSAHRFLADSYSVLPHHEIARVSELLQSQLLQPINITPIQPSLAESSLFSISGGGPANPSFQEFNPLFNRNRLAFQGTGIFGENSTYGGEGSLSGIYNKLSFSGACTHFETDGWRKNSDLDDDIVNVFGQLELSYKTSIQAEYRYRDTDKGDLQQSFFEDNISENLRQDGNINTFRLGFRHAFSPRSDLIGNFQYQDANGKLREDFNISDPFVGNFDIKVDLETDDNAYGGELQHLFRSQYANSTSGVGYFEKDTETTDTTSIPFFQLTLDRKLDDDVNHANVYLYSYIKPLENLTLTIGASYDDFNADSSETPDENQFNPKFGITWYPFPDTTLRAAAFRTLNRTLITGQTLEPTQVAGFNQFFNDLNATDAWRFGGAVDQKFSENIYGGIEYSYRDLEVPYSDFFQSNKLKTADWDEYQTRAYLYWTPHDLLALSAEWLWEDFKRDKDFTDGAKEVETHYIPLGINFFHPSGLSASLKGTYIDQNGKYERQGTFGTFEDGDDKFWIVDAAISYRLPKRYGFISVGVTNLFDEDFKYFDTERKNISITQFGSNLYRSPPLVLPRIQPDRSVFLKFTLAF